MTAYSIYQRKEFKVYKFYPNYPFGNPEVYVGKGIASKPNGVEFKIVYFY